MPLFSFLYAISILAAMSLMSAELFLPKSSFGEIHGSTPQRDRKLPTGQAGHRKDRSLLDYLEFNQRV
jgi:hypothetical protein